MQPRAKRMEDAAASVPCIGPPRQACEPHSHRPAERDLSWSLQRALVREVIWHFRFMQGMLNGRELTLTTLPFQTESETLMLARTPHSVPPELPSAKMQCCHVALPTDSVEHLHGCKDSAGAA